MKKISLGLLLSIVLMLSACSSDPVARLEKAVEKTGKVEQYKMSVSGDIGTVVTGAEGEPTGDGLENVKLDMEAQVDKGKTKLEIKQSAMGQNISTTMYGDEKQSIMKMPFSDKYITMAIDTEGSTDIQQSQESLEKLSGEIYAEMIEKIKSDGEIALEKTEIELPAGKVKVDKGTVKLKSEDIKELLISIVDKMYNDEEIVEMLEGQTGETRTQEQRDKELSEMKSELEKVDIENFEYAVYIDGEDYIVGQDIKMDLMDSESKKEILSLDLDIRMWDMGKDQNIEFPELTEENSMSFEDYMKSFEIQMPENMEDFNPEDFNPEDFNMEDFNLEDMDLENMDIPEVTVE